MRILTLTWEFPPLVYGGLGRHVADLTSALGAAGHSVTVVTPGLAPAAPPPRVPGVRVVRPAPGEPTVPLSDLLAFVSTLGHSLARAALRAAADGPPFDVLHAHDWVVGQAAATVQDALDLPLVLTVHATEAGRHQGWLPGPLNRSIHATEAWVAGRAGRVIACSAASASDTRRLFALPSSRVAVVPNGVRPAAWHGAPASSSGSGPLVVAAGRLEYEKGMQILLRAVPRLRRRHPGLHVVIAGTGTYEGELRSQARSLRLGRAVRFAGRLPDAELGALLRAADVAVVPSLYEPFGMVALEAAACGAPRIVSGVGGLAEIVRDGFDGLVVPPSSVPDLADAVTALLSSPDRAKALATAAHDGLAAYDWTAVAARTARVYADAIAAGRPAAREPIPIPTGNLLHPSL